MSLAFFYLEDIKQQAKATFENYWEWDFNGDQLDDYMRAHGMDPDHQHHRLANLVSSVRAVCHEEGHDFIEEGEGGPDSGWIGARCSRCGECHYSRLY